MKRISVERLTIEMKIDIQGFTISKKLLAIRILMVLTLVHFLAPFIAEQFQIQPMILGIMKVETQGTLQVKSTI
jgi:hypothetical protein